MRGSTDTIGFYHICTDGRALSWMFQDDKDFISGINHIAICHLKTQVEIYAYVLMDNHVHFVIYGTILQCKAFINLFKKLTGKWIFTKYGIRNHLRLVPTEIIHLETDENILNAIAYIDRNPLIAGYRYLSGEYPWGTSRFMFKKHHNIDTSTTDKQTPISSFTRRQQRNLLNTKVIIPDNWTVNDSGMINPTSFINTVKVESLFKTSLRYSYFLAKKLEGIIEQQIGYAQKLFIPDKELRSIVHQILLNNYHTNSVKELGIKQRLEIAKTLKYKYASPLKQISRMIQIDESLLKGFI